MFDLSNLSNSAQANSLPLIVLSAMMSVCLSLLLVFTYEKTSRDVARPDHFIQSMLLFAVVTTTIMQSIGDSLARSFGIFGALAIIRFRSRIGNPRDVAFIFAAMAVGISSGVHSFLTGIVGTLVFCLVVFVLRLTPFSQKQSLIGHLRFDVFADSPDLVAAQKLIKQYARRSTLRGYRVFFKNEKNREGIEYEYFIQMKDDTEGAVLGEALKKLTELREVKLTFSDTYENPLEAS